LISDAENTEVLWRVAHSLALDTSGVLTVQFQHFGARDVTQSVPIAIKSQQKEQEAVGCVLDYGELQHG